MMGDGELAEGQVWEAAMAAGHFQLGSLVGIVDRNQLSIDGDTEDMMGIEPLGATVRELPAGRSTGSTGTTSTRFSTPSTSLDEAAGDGRPSWSSPTPSRAAASGGWRATPTGTSATCQGADYDDVIAEIEGGLQPLVAGGADG